ncbi:MAG: DUF3810 domain-containing protein [Bacteroidetes bacterium]|nr:DUF3810 domain-containing protein [Bacteroidota bacterium]
MKKWLARFYAHLMRRWTWWLLIPLALFIRVLAYFPQWVDRYYSNGLFPLLSRMQRFILGWIPFSIGDLLYGFLVLALLYQLIQLLYGLIRKRFTRVSLAELLQRIFFLLLLGYVGFNLLWGLNYNRPPLADRLHMQVVSPTPAELDTLATDLLRGLDHYARLVTPAQRDSFNQKKRLFDGAVEAYQHLHPGSFPSLYVTPSIKPSLFSYPGNYLGFQGYYNPFTGEAQVNTTIPRFLEPFVTAHEIAHQLGYSREQEANFMAVLACDRSTEPTFRYSMYFDLFLYTLGEISLQDTTRAKQYLESAPPQVKTDLATYRHFKRLHRNPLERVIMWLYHEFLRANNQPNGKYTYNEVVSWVIAYRRTFGRTSLL